VQSEVVRSTLAPGRYRIRVWARACREADVEFEVPAPAPIEIALTPAR